MAIQRLNVKADMRTWVETAMCLHIGRGIPLADTPALLAGRLLADMLVYWRFDVPDKWSAVLDNADFSAVAMCMRDYTLIDAEVDKLLDHAQPIRDALAAGDWASLRYLPNDVWDWVVRVSGLNRDDWEEVPRAAETALGFWVKCPRCPNAGKLTDIGRMAGDCDPYKFGATNSPHFVCNQCGTRLSFHSSDGGLQIAGTAGLRIKLVLGGFLMVAMILVYAAIRDYLR